MIICNDGLHVWLEKQVEAAGNQLQEFVNKLHDDDEGTLKSPDAASFVFEWSTGIIIATAESKVYADILASYHHATGSKDGPRKTYSEWVHQVQEYATSSLVNRAQYSAGSKSSLVTANITNEAETQAWAKLLDACKWALMIDNESEEVDA